MVAAGAADVAPVSVQKIYVEKKTKNDLESQATGYIFRSDGDSPPIYIKLGNGNIQQYDDVLKRAGKRRWNFFSPIELRGTRSGAIALYSSLLEW